MEIEFDLNNDFNKEVTFNFNDGRGPVPAHQHPKGEGWVANSAYVEDNCYIGPYAQVFGNAKVTGSALINDYARVYGNAFIYGNARVYGDAQVCGSAQIYGHARVSGRAKVYDNAVVTDNAMLYEDCEVYGNAIIRNFGEVLDHAKVYGKGLIYDNIKLYGHTVVTRKPICCLGFDYNAVITDHHVMLGCVVIPPFYMKKLGRRIISMMGYGDEITKKWLLALESVMEIYGCTDRQSDIESTSERKIFEELISGVNERSQIDPKYKR